MSKVCSLCGKKPVAGNNVSHSKRKTKRRFLPNLISKKFGGVKVKICTTCLRTLKRVEKTSKVPKADKVAEAQVAEENKKVEVQEVEKAEKKKTKKTSSKK